MKKHLPVLSLACLATITFGQEAEKYQKAQAKIKDQKEAEEKTDEEYSYWKYKSEDHDGYHEGYVIDAVGYKIQGIIKYGTTFGTVRLLKPSGETKQYNARECMEFGYDSYQIVSTGTTFMEVIYDLKSICVYKKAGAIGGPTTIPVYGGGSATIDSKGDGIPYYIRKKSQKEFVAVGNSAKKLSKYFDDCPYLYENIKAKRFGTTKDDITAIASIYDRECAPAKK